MAANDKTELVVEGKTLHLSNLGKLMYPEAGFTKSHMIDYYIRISSCLLPHLKDRPITLKRYPDGITGEYFYEKRAPGHTPTWVQRAIVERSSGKPEIEAVLINDLPALIWSANLANLELHTPLARTPHLDQPTMVVFDLDPGPPADVLDCAQVALWLRDLLESMGLPCVAKTSGSKGMQLYVPLNTPVTYEQTRGFSKGVAEALRREHRDQIVVEMAKHLRTGKVFIDYSQNASRKTTVCVYSLRAAHASPFVSAPVKFDELKRAIKKGDANLLYFSPKEILKRTEKDGDLFESLLTEKHDLPIELPESAPAAGKDTSIRTYNAKRDFSKTQEPSGSAKKVEKEAPGLLFVIQKHQASHLHYDFRLEMEGVLRSWAVPKGIPTVHEDKRLAMHVEDHPMGYARFEGIIPKGNYGAGTVMVWDIGTYSVKDVDPVAAYRSGKISMLLQGKKLNGEWTLFRIGRKGESREWMLLKKKEDHTPISEKQDDTSAITRRSMKKIAEDHDAEWISDRPASGKSKPQGAKVPTSIRKEIESLPYAQPAFVDPMQSKLVTDLPEGHEWIYEIKLDGYRALAIKNSGKISLISRNNKNLTTRYQELVGSLQEIPGESFVLDGEIVVLDKDGIPSFQLLGSYDPKNTDAYLCYYTFDLLNFEGRNTRRLPLEARKDLLRRLIPTNDGDIRFNVSLETDPEVLKKEVRKRNLEGIVSKRRSSIYEAGKRSGAWVKWRASNAQEFVVGGYQPSGDRSGVEFIVVGYYEGRKLLYAARVRAGFTPHSRAQLLAAIKNKRIAQCPFANLPEPQSGRWNEGFTEEDMKTCIWVRPEVVCRVQFTEWTTAGHLRHAMYEGLLPDHEAKSVVREM